MQKMTSTDDTESMTHHLHKAVGSTMMRRDATKLSLNSISRQMKQYASYSLLRTDQEPMSVRPLVGKESTGLERGPRIGILSPSSHDVGTESILDSDQGNETLYNRMFQPSHKYRQPSPPVSDRRV